MIATAPSYSRDALENVLQALVKDPSVGSISILAHSMGNYVVVEALRQMAIRDRRLSPKIKDVMLASPDIDVDVFRRQIAVIDSGPRSTDFFLFVSRDDRALGLSSFLARDSTRLGALDPTKEPYRSILEQGRVHVVDLTELASPDATNHGKFATEEVVAAIGAASPAAKPSRMQSRAWWSCSARSRAARSMSRAPSRLRQPASSIRPFAKSRSTPPRTLSR